MRRWDKDTLFFILYVVLGASIITTMAFKIGYILGDTDATRQCIELQKKR